MASRRKKVIEVLVEAERILLQSRGSGAKVSQTDRMLLAKTIARGWGPDDAAACVRHTSGRLQ